MAKSKSQEPRERDRLPVSMITALLTECGYRCAVPTCRTILAIDMHHIWEVNAGGPDELWNLIALCPTCHRLYHRGEIKKESIHAWKSMLVALSQAFDTDAIDKLLFLRTLPPAYLILSGDGVLPFARLIAAGLAEFRLMENNANQIVTYCVELTNKGRFFVEAWKSGDRQSIVNVLSPEFKPALPEMFSMTVSTPPILEVPTDGS